jgi:hypothetical protein
MLISVAGCLFLVARCTLLNYPFEGLPAGRQGAGGYFFLATFKKNVFLPPVSGSVAQLDRATAF